jgi:hypothetical protein
LEWIKWNASGFHEGDKGPFGNAVLKWCSFEIL